MSAKPCNRCGEIIVFGKEQETGRIIPLMVGARVYRVIKENIVSLDPKALVPHVCQTQVKPPMPPPDRDYSEPYSNE
jgi:hypothetical protein